MTKNSILTRRIGVLIRSTGPGAARVAPQSVFPSCTYIYSIQSPSSAPPRSPLLYKHRTSRQGSTHVYKTALLLVEEGIVHHRSSFIKSSGEVSHLFLSSLFALLSETFCGTAVRPTPADPSRACLISLDTLSLSLSLSISPSFLVPGRRFQPRSIQFGYNMGSMLN
jgi:hypothetical protein